MQKNEIKKFLYRSKPLAKFQFIRLGVAYYKVEHPNLEKPIHFEIPVEDMGEADYGIEMEGQHLNRWIVEQD